MRALILTVFAAIILVGCSSAADKAERQYKLVKSNPGAKASEICAAGKAVADAYLKAEDVSKYREATARTNIECLSAKLDAQSGVRE